MAEESLTLLASVQEDFKDPLDELSNSLVEVGLLAEEIFPIDVDARGTESTLAELEAIEQQVESIDDNVDISASAVGGGTSVPDGDADEGRRVATSGGTSGGFLDSNDLRRLRDQFGEAFSESTLIRRGGEVTHGGQLLEGGLASNVDRDGLVDAILDADSAISLNTLRRFESDDVMDVSEAFEDLADVDLLEIDRRGGLLQQFRDIKPEMGDFYSALAALLPLLFVYIGALPAVIGALGGLAAAAIGAAGALGALGGLALMGMGMEDGEFSLENLSDEFEELRDSFVEAFEPLANRLAPMAEDALDGLDRLFDRLAIAGDALMRLRDEARALGGYLIDVLPSIAEDFTTLADIASPIFADIGQFLEEADLIDAFAGALGQALPMLYRLSGALVTLIPMIFEMSLAFLTGATYITEFLTGMLQLIDMVPGGIYLFGALATTLLTAYTVMAVAGKMATLFGTILGKVSVQGMALSTTLSNLSVYMSQYGIATGLAAFATSSLARAVALFWTAISAGLMAGVLVTMIDQLGSLESRLDGVTGKLQDFRDVSNNLNGPSIGMGGGGSGGGTYTSFSDNRTFNVTANNQEDADRAAQSLSFNTTYEQGKNTDTQFTTG